MDPRHPELAVARIKELIEQYDRIELGMRSCTTASKLGQLEREGGLVVQEICLVAPRIHEAMMQTSRQRRHDLSRGNIYDQMREYAATAERVDEPVEKPVEKSELEFHPEQAGGTVTLEYRLVENSLQSVKNEPTEASQSVTATEVYTAPNQAETVFVEPKPRKRKTAKKVEK